MILYLRLFNDGDQGNVELFSGISDGQEYNWELIYTWKPRLYGDTPYAFLPVSVLSLQTGSNSLLVTWIDVLLTEYLEGIGSLFLEFNIENGEINEFWID